MADVDGNGSDDIVSFTQDGVVVSFSNDGGLSEPQKMVNDFGTEPGLGGRVWLADRHPIMMADVNNDNKDDIVGFWDDGVYVSLSTRLNVGAPTIFGEPTRWVQNFGYGDEGYNWRIEQHPRFMADVNNDGNDDVIGFGISGVWVSLSNGWNKFEEPKLWVQNFGAGPSAGEWQVDKHPRMMADVNGDDRADVVGFGISNIYVSLASADDEKFEAPKAWGHNFTYDDGWRVEYHPRMMADVDGDGADDVVAFGSSDVYVLLAAPDLDSFEPRSVWAHGFGIGHEVGNWQVDQHPRRLVDVNGDRRADIVGFGPDGVLVGLSTGSSFELEKDILTDSLKVDFNSTTDNGGPHNQCGYQPFNAAHQSWSFYESFEGDDKGHFFYRSDSAFDDAFFIDVSLQWPAGTRDSGRHMLDRHADFDKHWHGDKLDLLTDFVGMDTQNAGGSSEPYLRLSIDGLSAGKYDWTSFHHDTEYLWTDFKVRISTGYNQWLEHQWVDVGDYQMSSSSPGGEPANPNPISDGPVTTVDTTFFTDGRDPVIMEFLPEVQPGHHKRFFSINGFELSATKLDVNDINQIGDFNGDGKPDIVNIDDSTQVFVAGKAFVPLVELPFGPIPDIVIGREGADDEIINLSSYFESWTPGNELTFVATSSNDSIANVNIDGDELRISFGDRGSTEITVRATNCHGEFIEDTFLVSVDDEAPEVVNPIDNKFLSDASGVTEIDLSDVFLDYDGDDFSLTVSANDDPQLVSAHLEGNILRLDYDPQQIGEAQITIRATDQWDAYVEDAFMVAMDPGNEPPEVLEPIEDVVVRVDSPSIRIDLADTFYDEEYYDPRFEYFEISVSNDNPHVVGATLQDTELVLHFARQRTGCATITLRATDPYWAVADESFTVSVASDELTPVCLDDITVDEDSSNMVIDLSNVGLDVASIIYLDAMSDNGGVVLATTQGTLLVLEIYRHRPHLTGKARIDIVVASDSADHHYLYGYLYDSFTVNVPPVTDRPVVARPIRDFSTYEDSPGAVIDLSYFFVDVDDDDLTMSVTSNSNTEVVSTRLDGTTLFLDYMPQKAGSAQITVRATDNSDKFVEDTFTVVVVPVNDRPVVVNPIHNITVDEDSPNTRIELSNVFADVDDDDLTMSVTSNNNTDLVSTRFDGTALILDYTPQKTGSAQITVRATDNSDKYVEHTFTVEVKSVNDPPPTVVEVAVTNTNWSNEFVDEGLEGNGFVSIPFNGNQLKPIPWAINRIRIRFRDGVIVEQDDLFITGVNQRQINILGFEHIPGSNVAIWNVGAIGTDKIRLHLSDTVVASNSGLELDGDWTDARDATQSGDGTPGGHFRFRINMLPGDADRNGTNSLNDLQILATNWQQSVNASNHWADFDGSGSLSLNDLQILATNWQQGLPDGEPAEPPIAAKPLQPNHFDLNFGQGNRELVVDKMMAGWGNEANIQDSFEWLLAEPEKKKRLRLRWNS